MTGCTSFIKLGLANAEVISIHDIKNQNEATQTVKVEGVVKKIIPLVDRKGFEVKDETGSIWVITEGNTPKVGTRISVEGKLKYKEIVIGNETLKEFYLENIEKISTDNTNSTDNMPVDTTDSMPEQN